MSEPITVASSGRIRRGAVRQEVKKSFFYKLIRRKKKRSKRKNPRNFDF